MKNIPTLAQARKVLEVVDAGLCRGKGEPIPGQMCIEAAVCYALGEPHGDEPSCIAPSVRRFKIRLNDAVWSSNAARAAGMRALAIAQLGSKDNIDELKFSQVLVKLTIQRVLPFMLRKARLNEQAERCEKEGSQESALEAKSAATAYAATAAAADAAAYAYAAADAAAYADSAAAATAYAATADAAAYAAAYADAAADAATVATAYAAATADAARFSFSESFRDELLTISANCCLEALREVNAPGIELLNQLGIK